MQFKVAAVSFLNTIPLTEGLVLDSSGKVELSLAMPSQLSEKLLSGSADVALLPVVEIFRGKSGGMLPGTGIACRGTVDTVKLFSSVDPALIKRVFVDRGSRTSVALLRILLLEIYGVNPEFIEIKPETGKLPEKNEAFLIIGDRCFEYEKYLRHLNNEDIGQFDLGALWLELTRLPFVFAAWAVAPDFVEKFGSGAVKKLTNLLSASRDFGLANLENLAAREVGKGYLGCRGEATISAVTEYFRKSLVYRLEDSEMEGLKQFFRLCKKHKIISESSTLNLL